MINVEVGKGLFEMALGHHVLHLQASHYELCEIDKARTVGVDNTHQQTHSSLGNRGLSFKTVLEFSLTDDTIMISIEVLEDFYKISLFFGIEEL